MILFGDVLAGICLSAADTVPFDPASLIFFGFFITAVGVLSLIRPQVFWHLRVGRKIPGVPPNSLYILVLRFGAVLVIILGLLMIFGL